MRTQGRVILGLALLAAASSMFPHGNTTWGASSAANAAADHPRHDPCHEFVTDRQRERAGKRIRLAGFDCNEVEVLCPYRSSKKGYTAFCDDYRKVFHLENHGGKWSITAE